MGQVATRSDLVAITDLVRSLREQWPRFLVESVLQSHYQRVDLADLIIACTRYAADPSNTDVRGMCWRGPHWRGLDTQPGKANERVLCRVCLKPQDRCLNDRAGAFPADDPRADVHEFEPIAHEDAPVIR